MRKLILLAAVSGMVGLMPTLAGAQTVTPQPKVSEREWMRANGEKPGTWMVRHLDCSDPNHTGNPCAVGTGEWVTEPDKALTHATMKPLDSSGNLTKGYQAGVNCQSACHYAAVELGKVSREVTGFTNFLGVTATYSGGIDPGTLLTDPANTTAHAAAFNATTTLDAAGKVVGRPGGCAACHSPEAATTEAGASAITGCQSCHKFSPTDPNTPHDTHVVLIQAELPLGDFANTGGTSCAYCHGGLKGETGNGTCWNCHLSGHWPKTANGVAYWQPLATGLDLPAVPALPVSAPELPAVPALP